MDLSFLKRVSLLKDLTSQELKLFASKLKLIKYKEGDAIITEHELSDKLFILYSGEVSISKKMTMIDEQEQINKTLIVLTSQNHIFFGEIGLLGFQKRTATASAKTDCELYIINQQDFMNICIDHPTIGFKVLLEISRKLSLILEKTNDDVLKLTTALIYALKG